MQRVATEAGVTKRTVQHRWKTVDQLRASAVALAFADIALKINHVPKPWGPNRLDEVAKIVANAPATSLISWWTASRSSAMPQDVRDGVEWGWRTLLAAIRRVTKRRGGQYSSESLVWEAARLRSGAVDVKPAPPLLSPPDAGLQKSDDKIYAAWDALSRRW